MKHFWQLTLLIKKNMLLRRRTWCYTCIEVLIPILYTLFFCLMRLYIPNQYADSESTEITEERHIPVMPRAYTVIGYAPRSPATDDFMSHVERNIFRQPWFDETATLQLLGFKSEFSMMRFVQKNPKFLSYAYAFGNVTFSSRFLPENLTIIMRLKNNMTTYFNSPEFYSEAIMLQILMSTFIDHWSGQVNNISIDYQVISPTVEPRRDSFLVQDMYRIALIIVGLTAYLVWRNTYLIASERERSILKFLKHMGVNPVVYWLSWFITTLFIIELVCWFFAGLLFVGIFDKDPVLKASDSSLIVIYFSALGFTLSAYCVLGSVLFKSAETCSAVASILYVIVTFPAIDATEAVRESHLPSVLFVSVNLISAITHIGHLEHQGPGYRWRMISTLKYPQLLATSLVICGFLYLFLTWMFYSIVICRSAPRFELQSLNTCSSQPAYTKTKRDGKTYSKIGIRVEKLCVSSSRKLTDVTMIMLEDTITVITGHELSGKATFMSVLKGEVRPSSGTVTIYGLDIVNNIIAVKLITGLCPRELTAIFPELTVGENLHFFATMKHLCQEKEMSNIQELARDFDLHSVLNASVRSLCASDKRLLQVAVAFLGQNKVILLEDPSLNMDIPTKYRLWSIIREKAYDKTVVLNTNIADEAEMAGDRIAIFLKGELKCCGTLQYINLFLGAGYYLVIEKTEKFKGHLIEYIVCNLIRNASQTDNNEGAMTFWLPVKTTEAFHSLFSLLYTHKHRLGLANFTVNATTLNDAIVNLSEYDHVKKEPITVSQGDTTLLQSSSDMSLCNTKIRDTLNNMLNDFYKNAYILQVAILLLLSYWINPPNNELFCYMNECEQLPIFKTLLTTAVFCTPGPHSNNASRALVEKYKSIFQNSDMLPWEYDDRKANLTTVATNLTKMHMRAVVGVRFKVADNSSDYQATVFYLPNDIDVGTSILRSLSAVMNAFLKYLTGSDRYFISATTHHQMVNVIVAKYVSGDQAERQAHRFSHHASVLNAVSLLLVPYFLVLERKTGSKDVQLLSGTSPWVYWATTFLFDLMTYFFLCNTYSLNSARESTSDTLDIRYQLTFLYLFNGMMMIIYVYVMQSFFSSPSTAVGFMMIFNYCLGNPSSTFLKFTHENVGMSVKQYLTFLFLLAPPHLLPQAVYHLIMYSRAAKFCNSYRPFCIDPTDSNYREDCCLDKCLPKRTCLEEANEVLSSYLREIPIQLAAMLAHIIVWGSILILIEYKSFSKLHRKRAVSSIKKDNENIQNITSKLSPTPGTIQAETRKRSRYNLRRASSFIYPYTSNESTIDNYTFYNVQNGITLENIEKKIGEDVLVSGINVQIDSGDMFCFAGADITEPSIVVDMICGLEIPTSGEIHVNGRGFNSFGRPQVPHLGYCSNRTNGVLPTMTGQETLNMFASLRGVAEWNIKRLVEIYLNAFHLEDVATKHSSSYSDCELRRLSIAASVIGEPDISLLCNPFYKLDSESKEAVWKWLKRLTNLKKTIVLASDNLQEIGSNAAYIMILVNGRPVCVGTAESIEELYCKGYTLLVKLDPRTQSGSLDLFISMLKEKFPECQLFHGNKHLLHFHIPYGTDCLADMFATIENIKKQIKIESYRVNRTNLDQILTAAQNAYFVHGISSPLQGMGDQTLET